MYNLLEIIHTQLLINKLGHPYLSARVDYTPPVKVNNTNM